MPDRQLATLMARCAVLRTEAAGHNSRAEAYLAAANVIPFRRPQHDPEPDRDYGDEHVALMRRSAALGLAMCLIPWMAAIAILMPRRRP